MRRREYRGKNMTTKRENINTVRTLGQNENIEEVRT